MSSSIASGRMVRGMKFKLITGRKLPPALEEAFEIHIQILVSSSSDPYCRKQSADWFLNPVTNYTLNPKQTKKVIDALISVFGDPLSHYSLIFSVARILQILIRKINYNKYPRNNIGWLVKKGMIEHLVRLLNVIPSTDPLHEFLLNIFSVICGSNRFGVERARHNGFLNFLLYQILHCPEHKVQKYLSILGLLMYQEDTSFDEFIKDKQTMPQAISRVLELESNWTTNMSFIICDRYITSKNPYRITSLVDNRAIIESFFEHLISLPDKNHVHNAIEILSKIIKFGDNKIPQKLLDYGILNFVHRTLKRSELTTVILIIDRLLFSNPTICRVAVEKQIGIEEVIQICYHPNKDIMTFGVRLTTVACTYLDNQKMTEFLTLGAGQALKDVFLKLHSSGDEMPSGVFDVISKCTPLRTALEKTGLSQLIESRMTLPDKLNK